MITLLRKHFFSYLKEVTLRVLFLESMGISPQGIDRVVVNLYARVVDPEIFDQWMDDAIEIFRNAVKDLLTDLYDMTSATLIMRGKALITDPDESSEEVVRPPWYGGSICMTGEEPSPIIRSVTEEEET